MIPAIKFEGDFSAQIMNGIFAETLRDLLAKTEDGTGEFPEGFLHTSTLPHEGTQYYRDMWARDCGRGVIELAQLGFAKEALATARYFVSHINFGDHWGRELHHNHGGDAELDGNMLILMSLCHAWQSNGKDLEIGRELLDAAEPVIGWVGRQMENPGFEGLLPSKSELSGNPNTPYPVYPIFGNYGMFLALSALGEMASYCGMAPLASTLTGLAGRMMDTIGDKLIADGKNSLTTEGCWLNGLDGRDGRAYDFSEWDGTAWPIYHWTRQLPFILHPDAEPAAAERFAPIHLASYASVRHWMCTGEFFRKYGFVSNTGWSGMGGRHDETMCGYGQAFFTQAALLQDDVNVYGKCLEGVARLGYDGNVVEPMAYEMNPFVMHECFNYENYERGLDHTFGVMSEGRKGVMDNPGDEGNLVQAAEIIKALRLVAGVSEQDGRLTITPRLPWLWDAIEPIDYPVLCSDGKTRRITFRFAHERWRRACRIQYTLPAGFNGVDVRFGPFPGVIPKIEKRGLALEQSPNATWVWIRDLPAGSGEFELVL